MKRILYIVLCLLTVLAALLPSAAYAVEKQEDPDAARPTYSAISLLRYYSASLDLLLQIDTGETEVYLIKMPFANIPEALGQATTVFGESGIALVHSLEYLSGVWEQEKQFINQYRLEEARKAYELIVQALPQAYNELDRLDSTVAVTGDYLKISSGSSQSNLQTTYNEILEKLARLREMLDLFGRPLIDEQGNFIVDEKGNPIIDVKLIKETDLTLVISPETAFVGDEIQFEGLLSSAGIPLGDREIEILIGGSTYFTIRTDKDGSYEGTLQLPYWYISEVGVQSLYYPRGEDVGSYLAAASPEIRINLLYYEAGLVIVQQGKAYPGRKAVLQGVLGYRLNNESFSGAAVHSDEAADRKLEIYLDDELISEFTAGSGFTRAIDIDPQTPVGNHVATISAGAYGRYAPAASTCTVFVEKAAVTLDWQVPDIALIPGAFDVKGKLRSELGPLNGAEVIVTTSPGASRQTSLADGSRKPTYPAEAFPAMAALYPGILSGYPPSLLLDSPLTMLAARSKDTGDFENRVKMGMGLSLLGIQTISIKVQPLEPWNAPLTAEARIFMINYINLSIIFAVIVFLAVFLPRRLKSWYVSHPRTTRLPREQRRAETVPVYIHNTPLEAAATVAPATTVREEESISQKILNRFETALKLVQKISGTLMKPQHTLREFARESSPKLGPFARPFNELVKLVEKIRYSHHKPDKEDEEKAGELTEELTRTPGGRG